MKSVKSVLGIGLLLVCWYSTAAFGYRGIPDVTTLYRVDRPKNVTCVSRTNALGYPFVTPGGGILEPWVEANVPSCRVEMSEQCDWTSMNWSAITSCSKYSLPHIAPEQKWNLSIDGTKMSKPLPFAHPYFHFRLGVSNVGTERLLLMETNNVETSELLVIDMEHQTNSLMNQSSPILRCGKGMEHNLVVDIVMNNTLRNCKQIGKMHQDYAIDEGKDIIFRIELEGGYMKIWKEDTNTLLVDNIKIKNCKCKYIAAVGENSNRTRTITLARKSWVLMESEGQLRSPPFITSSHSVCLSFFYYMNGNCNCSIVVYAKVNGTVHHLETIENRINGTEIKSWKLYRANQSLTDTSEVKFLITAFKSNSSDIVSIHGITGCNEIGKEDRVTMTVSSEYTARFICEMAYSPKFLAMTQPSTEHCSKCANGGICDQELGVCACPPGFTGILCEDACGKNLYGHDCAGQCTATSSGCRSMELCNPYVGCLCAPGYYGTHCNDSCLPGMYGGSCMQQCGQCQTNIVCDAYTGHCMKGCKDGYFPPYCKDYYTFLLMPPVVTNISYSEVTVTFSTKPENLGGQGSPSFYQIEYLMVNNGTWYVESINLIPKTRGDVHHRLAGLEAEMDYQLRVVFIDRDGYHYVNESIVPTTHFTTPCQIPELPLYNLNISWTNQSSFAVDWKYQVNSTTACKTRYYNVFLKEKGRYYLYKKTNRSMIVISDRVPNFGYKVKIQAVTTMGQAPVSKPIVVTTKHAAPSQVISLHSEPVSPTELLIKWNKPRKTNGLIMHYQIEYKCLQYLACPKYRCNESHGKTTSLETSVTLTNLLPHAQYEICVTAFTVELGPFTMITAMTGFGEPDAAPMPSPNPIQNSSSTSLTVSWLPVEDCRKLNGFPIGYHYSLYRIDVNANSTLKESGNILNPPITFNGLLPHQNYEVHIQQLVTGNMYSKTHLLVIKGKTCSVEPPAVRNLQSMNVTPHEAIIRWDYTFIINKYIPHNFTVDYKCLQILACPLQEGQCSRNVSMNTNETHVRIMGLLPDTTYSVEVSAYIGRKGVTSNTTVTTLVAVPEAVPTMSLQPVKARGQNWAEVQWLPPADCSLIHGKLVGYGLCLKAHGDVISESRTNNSTSRFNFTQLAPLKEYQAEIYIVTSTQDMKSEMFSNRSINFTFITLPPAPDPVTELVAYALGSNKVWLRYQIPDYPYGTIEKIIVKYGEGEVKEVKKMDIRHCQPWPEFFCATVEDLLPYRHYNIAVSLSSNEDNTGSSTSIIVFTREEIPGPPTFLKLLNRTETSVTLQWGIPNMFNGVLRGFEICHDQVASFNPKHCCSNHSSIYYTTTNEEMKYSIQVTGLQPASTYIMTVRANTIKFGPNLHINVHTLPGKPQAIIAPVVIPDSITNYSVDVELMALDNAEPISAIFVVVNTWSETENCKEDDTDLKKEICAELDSKSYLALEFYKEEMATSRRVTVGTGEMSKSMYGTFNNKPLQPSIKYSVSLLVMSAFEGSHFFSNATSKPFMTKNVYDNNITTTDVRNDTRSLNWQEFHVLSERTTPNDDHPSKSDTELPM